MSYSVGVQYVRTYIHCCFICIVLESTAGLLSLDPFRLGDALTQKYMVLRGEEITTPLTVQQVYIRI